MTAHPSGVLSKCKLPKNTVILTIGSKSILPKAIWFKKDFVKNPPCPKQFKFTKDLAKRSLTKCYKFSYLQFLGWKYLEFDFWESFDTYRYEICAFFAKSFVKLDCFGQVGFWAYGLKWDIFGQCISGQHSSGACCHVMTSFRFLDTP